MARKDPQLNLRIPAETKQRLEDCSKESGRTITAELVYRLEESFKTESELAVLRQKIDALTEINKDQSKRFDDLMQASERLLALIEKVSINK